MVKFIRTLPKAGHNDTKDSVLVLIKLTYAHLFFCFKLIDIMQEPKAKFEHNSGRSNV